MGNGDQESTNKTVREWIRVIGTLAAAIGIFFGVWDLWFTKEKEASDRLLNIITLLDSEKCRTVRAGAVSTMGVYLGDYEDYQGRAFWVMANNLATEEDSLVRDNILNILKGAKANAIEPLACMSRFLLEEEMLTRSSFLFRFDLAFQSDLDNGSISDELRKKFKNNYVELSECVTVLVVEKDSRWFVTNRDNKPTYIVKKERDQLNVYEKDIPIELGPIDKLSILWGSENLRDITKALVAVLEKKDFPKDEKLHLHEIILCNIDEPSSKINLDKANLKQASLKKAYLKDVSLKAAVLEQANLEEAVLDNVDLAGAKMRGANLDSVELRGDTILRIADLTSMLLFSIKAKKFQSDLDRSMISKDLQQEFENNGIYLSQNATVSIEENDTKYMIFDDGKRKCRISKEQGELNIYSDTILDFANLQEVDLSGALLTNASLQGATLTHANMVNASLQGADLFEADLANAVLANANLANANMTGAILQGANLEGANLEGANLEDANLANANLKAKVLFRIDSKKFQGDLDKGAISEDLRQEFANNRIYLSQSTTVSIEEENRRWLTSDKENKQTYTVRKEERLNICTEPNIVETELFSVDSKKFKKDLDEGNVSEDLRWKFKNNWIDLSENIAISVKEKGRIWLINDKDNKQTYTVRNEEWLNICRETKFDFTGIKKAKNWDKAIFDDDVRQKLMSQQD